jgi:hypothetical protein
MRKDEMERIATSRDGPDHSDRHIDVYAVRLEGPAASKLVDDIENVPSENRRVVYLGVFHPSKANKGLSKTTAILLSVLSMLTSVFAAWLL